MPLVLVADDNPVSLRFMVEALADCDCDCVAAEDGDVALRHAMTSAFDLLVLDVHMPRLGGADVLRRLRTSAAPSHAAVAIATTAADSADVIAQLHEAGFVDVLLKPIAVEAFRHAVTMRLAGRSLPELDDVRARATTGGDAAIMASLRALFAEELLALPTEIAQLRSNGDSAALRDRLHRLDASAGFCGATALASAIQGVRAALHRLPWPEQAVGDLLDAAERTRLRIGR